MFRHRLVLSILTSLALAAFQPSQGEPPQKVDLFGDPLPQGAIARIGTVRMRHGCAVDVLAYSPDGKMLASTGRDATVSVWDTATGKELHRLRPDGGWCGALAWSADSKELIGAGGESGQRWDVTTGKSRASFPCPGGWKVLSPDGRLVAGIPVDKEPVRVFDTTTGKEIASFGGGVSNERASFSPDGKLLAVEGAQGEPCRLWDVSTGKELRTVGKPRSKEPRTEDILAFSPNGKTIAQVPGSSHFNTPRERRVLKIWDAATGEELREVKCQQDGISIMAFSADGKMLATGTPSFSGSVFVWNLETGKVHGTFGEREKINELRALTFSPDGKTLAMGCDRAPGIRLWDLATWKEITFEPEQRAMVLQLMFSPDNKALALAALESPISVWNPSNGKLLRRFEAATDWVLDMTFAADGQNLVSGEEDRMDPTIGFNYLVRSWDVATGKERGRLSVKGLFGTAGLALSPGGALAVFGDQDGRFQMWDIPGRKQLPVLQGAEKQSGQPLMCADGKRLVTVVGGTSFGMWDLVAGKELALHKSEWYIRRFACSSNGELLAGANKQEVHVWDLSSGKETVTLAGHKGGVTALCFAPDGKLLVSAGEDHTVRLWDVAAGKELGVLEGHRGAVYALAFSLDGKLLATGSDDTTTLIWDVGAVIRKK